MNKHVLDINIAPLLPPLARWRTCWVVERVDGGPRYLTMKHGEMVWTDHWSTAMKFFDRISAEQVVEDCGPDIAIRQHMVDQEGMTP